MENKKYMFLFLLLFMFVFSISAVSADNLTTTDSGAVSGDVDVTTSNPWSTSGELKYDIPSEAKEIKSAHVYVNVYGGKASNDYGANANVTLKTNNNEKQIANEKLWHTEGSTDGTIYEVNNHTTKCYSDYQMYYDITDSLKGLNGTSISIKVDTYKIDDETNFDGRIKLIALVLAYNDNDDDIINYWINSGQAWTKTDTTTQFNTSGLTKSNSDSFIDASLFNVALSSSLGTYKINDIILTDSENQQLGDYYQYNHWYVGDKIKLGENTTFISQAGSGQYASLKNVLSILKVKFETIKSNVSLGTEYSKTCYAGTNNTITITVNTNKTGTYLIELLANGEKVASDNFDIDDTTKNVRLTDPTIRDIDETTVNGADNKKVNYTVNIKYQGQIINSTTLEVPVLYNGYLGKDLEFNTTYMENFKTITITGDIVIDIQNVSTYLAAKTTNRTDMWAINLNKESNFVNAFVYIAYNWDKTEGTNGPEINITFNGNNLTPISHYRDQSNLGGASAKYGYGLYIYDVSKLIQNGNNILTLNKINGTTAIYPSTLIYLYNTTNSNTLKTVYIANGADLLYNNYNEAKRIIKTDSQLNVNTENLNDAKLYVFAASADSNDGNIIFNSNEDINVWNGSSNGVECYTKNISNNIKDSNKISFVATGSTILALQQIIVTSKNITKPEPEQNSTTNQTVKPTKKVTKKVASKITAKNKTFKVKTKVKKYTVTLKSGKKGISKVWIYLTLKGKKYKKTLKVRTNTKGKATFKIKKLTKKGKYTATINFKGNKNYKKTSKKVKITVK